MGRWIAVRGCSFAMRHGLNKWQCRDLLVRCFRHRDYDWRERVIEDAQVRNYQRHRRTISAP